MFVDYSIVGAVCFDDYSSEYHGKQNERHHGGDTDADDGFEVVDEFHGFGVGLEDVATSMSAPSFCI